MVDNDILSSPVIDCDLLTVDSDFHKYELFREVLCLSRRVHSRISLGNAHTLDPDLQ